MNNKTTKFLRDTEYYVISHSQDALRGVDWYLDPDNYGTTQLERARRFNTAGEAFEFCGRESRWASLKDLPLRRILHVIETQEPRQVQLVSKTKINPTKPVALFNVGKGVYGKVQDSHEITAAASLNDATVFNDLADALTAVTMNGIVVRSILGRSIDPQELKTVHVHQVEIIPGGTKITKQVV